MSGRGAAISSLDHIEDGDDVAGRGVTGVGGEKTWIVQGGF